LIIHQENKSFRNAIIGSPQKPDVETLILSPRADAVHSLKPWRMNMDIEFINDYNEPRKVPWNKGRMTGPKPPLRPKHVWAIRARLQISGRTRDLALFNLAIDSKLRGCDIVRLEVEEVAPHG
jgi:hypothetical protein